MFYLFPEWHISRWHYLFTFTYIIHVMNEIIVCLRLIVLLHVFVKILDVQSLGCSRNRWQTLDETKSLISQTSERFFTQIFHIFPHKIRRIMSATDLFGQTFSASFMRTSVGSHNNPGTPQTATIHHSRSLYWQVRATLVSYWSATFIVNSEIENFMIYISPHKNRSR